MKKTYINPEMEVVTIQHPCALLAGSTEVLEFVIGGDTEVPISDQDTHILDLLGGL